MLNLLLLLVVDFLFEKVQGKRVYKLPLKENLKKEEESLLN